jgi:acetyl-CoA carboxylase biotin carboxyl carrier protein
MDDDRPIDQRYAEETQTLRELLAIMHEHDLDEIKVKLGETTYELSRRQTAPAAHATAAPAAAAVSGQPASAGDENVRKVLAPLTGVFYRSPSPDAPVYVEVGDRIESGDVLCVLEAMKLFNEIQSDDAGRIVRVIPDNGELVSQGDELFWIEP